AQKIAEVLESNGLVSHPQVGVTVKEKRSKPITVVGAVAHPMVYEADRPTTLLEVLAQAGGIANDAGDTVIVTRPDPSALSNTMEPPPISPADALPPSNSAEPSSQSKPLSSVSAAGAADAQSAASTTQNAPPPIPSSAAEPPPIGSTITVNLADLLEAGDAKNNILLQGGDIVTIPQAGIVYVLGAVQRPGGFVATNDRAQLTTLKIVALAGGLSPTAKKDHAVIIRKDAQGQQQEVPVNLAKVLNREEEDVKLQPSDILLVPGSKTKAALIRAAEIGLGVGTAVAIYRLGTHRFAVSDESKLVPREPGTNGAVEVVPDSTRMPAWDLSPREPHLYDYLLILRKHQWLILSFLVTVVTIVSIATFRMRPVYVATARIEIDRENANILPFQGQDSYDYMVDLDNYIETQSKILTSETLALQTIR